MVSKLLNANSSAISATRCKIELQFLLNGTYTSSIKWPSDLEWPSVKMRYSYNTLAQSIYSAGY